MYNQGFLVLKVGDFHHGRFDNYDCSPGSSLDPIIFPLF